MSTSISGGGTWIEPMFPQFTGTSNAESNYDLLMTAKDSAADILCYNHQ